MRIDTGEAAALLRKVSGKSSIKGVHTHWMRRALESKGYRCQELPVERRTIMQIDKKDIVRPKKAGPSLAQWLKDNPVSKRGTKVYLIAAGSHFVTVQGRRGGCNQTGGPVALAKMKKRRGVVSWVMAISPPGVEHKAKVAREAKLQPFKTVENALAALAKAKEEEKRAQQRVLDLAKRVQLTRAAVAKQAVQAEKTRAARVRREAAKLGVRIERDQKDWWVFGPEEVYGRDDSGPPGFRQDPCAGSHFCTSASEVTETIEFYLDDLKQMKLEQGVA